MNTSQKIYSFFADQIYQTSGIFIPVENYYQLDARFLKLQKLLNLTSVEELYNTYANNPTVDQKLILIDVATNNETTFFRDERVFNQLLNIILPKKLKENQGKLSIWSCACSFGQEPYSLIMGLKEKSLLSEVRKIDLKILATDISTEALKYATEGVYSTLEVQRGLNVSQLITFFEQKNEKKFSIASWIKEYIKFEKLNLTEDKYPSQLFDVILCRNVLIYQKVEDREKILNKLYDNLNPRGVLILGNGESLIGIKTPFKSVFENNVICYFKE